jgi:DNA polymerase-3 subunit gamma/tau
LLDIAIRGQRPDFAQQVMKSLELWTGARWTVSISDESAASTLREAELAAEAAARDAVLADPLVTALFDNFEGARLVKFGPIPISEGTTGIADDDGDDMRDERRAESE